MHSYVETSSAYKEVIIACIHLLVIMTGMHFTFFTAIALFISFIINLFVVCVFGAVSV
jgi:hypothetical protein